MASTPIKPVTVDEFDISKVSMGNTREFADRGFTKYYMNYNREDKLDSKTVVKLENIKIQGVYPPNENNAKYGMLCILQDEKQIELIKSVESHMKNLAFENREAWFEDGDLEMEDVEASFKSMIKYNSTYNNTSFTISFPFMTDEVKDPVTLQYFSGCGSPTEEMIESSDLTVKLPRHSVVDLFLHFTNVKVENSSKDFNIQRTIYKRINVRQLGSDSASGVASGPRAGMNIDEIDVSNIVSGDVLVNERQGRSLRPKYKYTTPSGEEKLRSLTVHLPQVKVSFRRQVDDSDKTNFNIVYRLSEEHLAKFEEIDDYLKQDFYSNFSKYENGKRTTKKMLDKKFKGAVKHSEDYPANMWYTVYAEKKDDSFDFKGNFYKPDGTQYSNDEILSDIFGNTLTCDLNVYLKHIWFVTSKGTYSAKFNVGSVVVDTESNGVVYDLGDAYVDSGTVSVSAPTSPVQEEEIVSSAPEDSSAVESEEEN